ncbi:DegT/DnrJ/EryC1/StrS family aminotransferase [Chitinivibrio alkaliphilus]|uniref:Aminotransferase n=1 Tax=Chitinivibrio alkaliphilus ACht1 TaxID=1313304 RepID=U7D6V6_9BACT|nr:DegT/DnrJ/EryC1/StrS family aminotransferase [Chitinivibrio alkaliphilus]ERP30812.1 aminotransferase [Chitinivibrio alkaliphilus ACht1]
MIHVTKTYLPDKKKFKKYVDEIYENHWITNNGSMVRRLEERLCEYLGVQNLVLVSNGTVALEIAYRALGVTDFAVTSPFSFVATTSSLVTNNIHPIFADIDPSTYTMDPEKAEALITPNTSALVPVHVFGNPCDVDAIAALAEKYKIRTVYDAAHAFGVKVGGQSVLNYGDISTLSFHATKLFHTIEGGALAISDDSLVEEARFLINFGIQNSETIPHLGTNAKMNEFEAAMGLCVLDDMPLILERREEVYRGYVDGLKDVVQLQEMNGDATNNFSYFPVVFESEAVLKRVESALKEVAIAPRRYFYPSLDTLSYIEPKQECPVSRDISSRILCLPMYDSLEKDVQETIIAVIKTGCL